MGGGAIGLSGDLPEPKLGGRLSLSLHTAPFPSNTQSRTEEWAQPVLHKLPSHCSAEGQGLGVPRTWVTSCEHWHLISACHTQCTISRVSPAVHTVADLGQESQALLWPLLLCTYP